MNLRKVPSITQLQCFLVTSKSFSVKEAADVLSLTPGAVSKQIKNLEDFLGVSLFDRTSNRLSLTMPGKIFCESLSGIFPLLYTALDEVSNDKPSSKQHIRVGASHSVFSHLVMPYLNDFLRAHPKIKLDFTTQVDDYPALKMQDIDLVISYQNEDNKYFVWEEVYRDYLVAVGLPRVIAKYPKANSIEQILSYPFLLHDNPSVSFTEPWVNECGLASRDMQSIHCHRFRNSKMLLESVLSGLGISVFPYSYVASYLKEGILEFAVDKTTQYRPTLYFGCECLRQNDPEIRLVRAWVMKLKEIIQPPAILGAVQSA